QQLQIRSIVTRYGHAWRLRRDRPRLQRWFMTSVDRMRRIRTQPRSNVVERARETGFELLSVDGSTYWDESAYYGFPLQQIERHIEDPTKEFASLSLALLESAVGREP